METDWDADRMLELGQLHARLEEERDLDGLMATLVRDPVYEFHPLGMQLRGGDAIRRFYRQLFGNFLEHVFDHELVGEWVNDEAVVQEYDVTVEIDTVRETHRVLGILYAENGLLGGERIYGSDRVIRLMVGELFNELEPLG